MRTLTLLAFLFALSGSALADRLVLITRVIDGDTVETGQAERIRLRGIDAPERGQDGYDIAKRWAEIFLKDRLVMLKDEGDGAYGRTAATLYVPGTGGNHDLCRMLVFVGACWVDDRYLDESTAKRYERDMRNARNRSAGIWSVGNPIEPRLWRAGVRGSAAKSRGALRDGVTESLRRSPSRRPLRRSGS